MLKHGQRKQGNITLSWLIIEDICIMFCWHDDYMTLGSFIVNLHPGENSASVAESTATSFFE